jgi:hypothetical protein
MVGPGDERQYQSMTPTKKSASNDSPEPAADTSVPARTAGNKLTGWIGGLATRTGLAPIEVKGIMVVVVVATLVVSVVVPLSLSGLSSASTGTPVTAATSPSPTTPTIPTIPTTVGNDKTPKDPCENFLYTAGVASATGVSANVKPEPALLLLSAVGGIDCAYNFGDWDLGDDENPAPDDSGYLYVTVAPSAIADPAVVAASLSPTRCAPVHRGGTTLPNTECSATATFGAWWYSLKIGTFSSEEALREGFDSVTGFLEQSLGSRVAPTQALVVKPFDCSSVEAGGVPVIRATRDYTFSGEIATAADFLAPPTTCRFSISDQEEWDLRVFPGAAASYAQCTHNSWRGAPGAPMSVPGVQAAFGFALLNPDGDSAEACATDGKSTIEIWRSANVSDFPWDATTRDALGPLLSAAFAAATPSTSPLTPFVTPTTPTITSSPVTDGGCTGLFDPKTLKALTGGKVDFTHMQPESLLLATVGGISCDYSLNNRFSSEPGNYATVSVVPSSIINADEREATLVTPYCTAEAEKATSPMDGCFTVGEVAGWWYSLQFGTVGTVEHERASFETTIASLERTLSAADAPERASSFRPYNCDATSTAGRSFTSWRTVDNYRARQWIDPFFSDGLDPLPSAAFLLAGPVTCVYTMHSGEQWEVTVYAGNAAPYDLCVRMSEFVPGKAISIAGVKSAYIRFLGNDAPNLCATDGISTIEVSRPSVYEHSDDVQNWPKADAATLSRLLRPIFAAAG